MRKFIELTRWSTVTTPWQKVLLNPAHIEFISGGPEYTYIRMNSGEEVYVSELYDTFGFLVN